ncbi:double-strand break repair helicase AddA [Rhodosalinus halophilus]|uniref:DNA 3'-5' helicase n=1 Tax=Rhodosalinus halophilus TaxID=2259333 RepID=A0A365U7K6_9RHOB|nr:double-strand break repair helicase AddA [Rhodosalinus halophilus]RBI84706.1 double-strand break repair helicase AddA [Rhodosalinus halophilus]
MTPRDAASEAQAQAADPGASVWVSANAGSGKTKVLTDRVARLLLDGVLPEHILCLTYTKAAASEMQNRLFARLGEWAMLPEADLRREIAALGVDRPLDAPALARARTLFARAIEAPGGLKILTIHAFCAALLRRFPLEAGVSPAFTEMEQRAGELLAEEIVEAMAQGPEAGLLRALAAVSPEVDITKLCARIIDRRAGFEPPLDRAEACALFGASPDDSETAVLADVFLGGEVELIGRLCPILDTGGVNDGKAAAKLRKVTAPDLPALAVLEDVFLNGPKTKAPFSAKIGAFPSKALREGPLAAEMPALEALMQRVEAVRERRLALRAAEATATLHAFAAGFLARLEQEKQRRGWLDFDDLIRRAAGLLRDPAVADWVLYKLDGGIDHILVDEAQDTSPEQWEVIERLAREFTAGEGARPEVPRSLFVVGDRKQSIYSFQGADPDAFERMRADFDTRLAGTDRPLLSIALQYSFRSSQAVLRLVDTTFDGRAGSGMRAEEAHIAFKSEMPGRVDLWPAIPKDKNPEPDPWYAPLDRVSRQSPEIRLANRIADWLKAQLDAGTPIPAARAEGAPWPMRPMSAGDVLILVQRRSALFAEIIRACKARGLPMAGADRLELGAELAVRDLGALLQVLDLPEDDLSLATCLRSPLFGWSERALFDLAHGREDKYLWRALTKRRHEFPETMAVFDDLMAQADFLRPYDLLERILIRHDGRRKLIGRLGDEAADGIDALLGQALAQERSEVPSLTGFLRWMQAEDQEVKRQMDAAGDRIRVMTVHGAKGLEAPVVILPDCAARPVRNTDPLPLVQDRPIWAMSADEAPAPQRAAREAAAEAEQAERDRLLYVAMTRAESWLIVAAAGDLGKDGRAWHTMVQGAMQAEGAVSHDFGFDDGAGLRLEHGDWSAPVKRPAAAADGPAVAIPARFRQPAAPPVQPAPTLSPSDLGGPKALPGEAGRDEEAAKLRGTRLHLLLEHLPGAPAEHRADLARRLLGGGTEPAPEPEIAALLAEAEGVLDAPALAALFAPDALAEVPVSATLDALGGRRVHGTIDRLIVAPERVLAVDFKTNATVPATPGDVPEGLLRQMGAYAAALSQIWTDRRIETALLWTRTAELMPLPPDLVAAALARGTPA